MANESVTTNDAQDIPNSAKPAAVENWHSAIEELSGEIDDEKFLIEADIHNRQDRWKIEEILDNGDIPESAYQPLADAFHELRREFEEVWS